NCSPHLAFPILSFNCMITCSYIIPPSKYSLSLSADTVVACHPHHKGSGGSG
ncbi:hypothetical protein L208DRAFT_1384140, partial [Tricholoma matsutake]